MGGHRSRARRPRSRALCTPIDGRTELPATAGGKARGLHALAAAGLPIPPSFSVVGDAALGARARRTLTRLGGRLAVRSSATVEDSMAGSSAGLFRSEIGVAPAELDRAIARVRASAESPAVLAYLEATGRSGERATVEAIVQPRVDASVAGVLYTRLPENPRSDLIRIAVERPSAAVFEVARTGPPLPGAALEPSLVAALRDLALAAERAIGADRGADLEWLIGDDGPVLVQARPLVIPDHLPALTLPDPAEFAFSKRRPDVTYCWDVSHNPDPLSLAQAGIVEWVADHSDQDLHVVCGYLYYALIERQPTWLPIAEAWRIFFEEFAPACERALILLGRKTSELDAALRSLLEVAERSATFRETLARAKPTGAPPPRTGANAAPPLTTDLGAYASAWDVAAPPLSEVHGSQSLRRLRSLPPHSAKASMPQSPHVAFERLAEADDVFFFRAQKQVRSALLHLAARAGVAADDIFYVPLDRARAIARGEPADPAELADIAAANRIEARAQEKLSMPLAIRDGRAVVRGGGARRSSGPFRGVGGVGKARGRAVRLERWNQSASRHAISGAIVVARAVTPAAVVELRGASGLVCESGHALDHASSIARELRIPYVVGAAGAWHSIRDGAELWLDGPSGLVVMLGG